MVCQFPIDSKANLETIHLGPRCYRLKILSTKLYSLELMNIQIRSQLRFVWSGQSIHFSKIKFDIKILQLKRSLDFEHIVVWATIGFYISYIAFTYLFTFLMIQKHNIGLHWISQKSGLTLLVSQHHWPQLSLLDIRLLIVCRDGRFLVQ